MIKKMLAKILVAIMLVCGTFTLSSCFSDDAEQSTTQNEQSTESNDDKNVDSSANNSDAGDSGIWTPPAKQ